MDWRAQALWGGRASGHWPEYKAGQHWADLGTEGAGQLHLLSGPQSQSQGKPSQQAPGKRSASGEAPLPAHTHHL